MKIDVNLIKELRQITGAGLGDCKEALEASSGSMEDAKVYLREKGLSKAYKKSHRDVADGLVAVCTAGSRGAVLKLGSETDFVARNEKFCSLALSLVKRLCDFRSEDMSAFSSLSCEGSSTVAEEVVASAAVLGENVVLSGIGFVEVPKGVVGAYVHSAVAEGVGKAASIVALESDGDTTALLVLAKQIAMHVVAAKPEAVSVDSLSADIVEREKEIVTKQVAALGKPESVAQKIIDGRMQKFFEETVLLQQIFVIDGQTRICDLISKKEQDLGCKISIASYRFFSIG